jgi:hypothetical protein
VLWSDRPDRITGGALDEIYSAHATRKECDGELPSLATLLKQAERRWPGETLADRPVFFRPGGLPVDTFYKAWATACEAANVAGRIFHDLRRMAARDMVRSGTPERVAMTVTGHETRDVFERYNIVSDHRPPRSGAAQRGPAASCRRRWRDEEHNGAHNGSETSVEGYQGRVVSNEVIWWTILDLNQ